jgi:Protein of unknown function (DUF3800)
MYIDDSGTSPKNRVAVAAGWISPLRKWKRFEKYWERFKEEQGFDCFHMAECVYGNDKSEFRDWNYAKKVRVIRRLRDLTKSYADKGIAISVAKQDYDEVITGNLRKWTGEFHYTWAMRCLMGKIDHWRREQRVTEPMEYIIDWIEPGDIRRKEIELVFTQAENDPNAMSRYGAYPGCYSFRKRCDVLPLQATDMLAWLTYRRCLASPENPMNEISPTAFNDLAAYRDSFWLDALTLGREALADWARRESTDSRSPAYIGAV